MKLLRGHVFEASVNTWSENVKCEDFSNSRWMS